MIQTVLYISDSLGERFFVGGIIGLITSILLYFYYKWDDKKTNKNKKKEYEKKKTEAFVKSDSKGNGNYNYYLLDELIDKCNPQNFMDPYDYEKVKIANELYPQLLECNKRDDKKILSLRHEAIGKLGITITTQSIYEELREMCNPEQFMEPYNPDMVAKANELYSRIMQNKDNVIVLEQIRDEVNLLLSKTSQSNFQASSTRVRSAGEISDDNNSAAMPIILISALLLILLIYTVIKILVDP